MEELLETPTAKYTEEEIKGIYGYVLLLNDQQFYFPAAIQRIYENLRRQWKMDDENDDSEELRRVSMKKKKYRARRFRVTTFLYIVVCR